MTRILQINASLQAGNGNSTRLANRFVEALRSTQPDVEVNVRDLASDPVPHLDAARFSAFISKPDERSAEQQAVLDHSNALIEELRRADLIVIGLPLYNFGVPSQLKSWIDHVARAGETFRYTENGPAGLLTGKKALVFATRGGRYAGTARDTETTYVRDFLAFLGITDLEFVYAEGLAMGDEPRALALTQAESAIDQLGTVARRAA